MLGFRIWGLALLPAARAFLVPASHWSGWHMCHVCVGLPSAQGSHFPLTLLLWITGPSLHLLVQLGIADEAAPAEQVGPAPQAAVPDLPSVPSHKVTVPQKAAVEGDEEEEEEDATTEKSMLAQARFPSLTITFVPPSLCQHLCPS